MNKGRFSTLVMFFLSISVVFGGWFLTQKLLNYEEEKLLGRSGQVSMQSPEFILQGKEEPEETAGNGSGEGISDDRIEFILAAWQGKVYTQLHEPLEGQMDMEQAIETGLRWISLMSEQGVFPTFLKECSFDEVSASLSSPDVQTDFEKYLLSFWDVFYTIGDVTVALNIHAESGQVWSANISAENSEMPYKKIKKKIRRLEKKGTLLKTVFPFLEEDPEFPIVTKDNIIYKKVKGNDIMAGFQWDMFATDSGGTQVTVRVWLTTAAFFSMENDLGIVYEDIVVDKKYHTQVQEANGKIMQ